MEPKNAADRRQQHSRLGRHGGSFGKKWLPAGSTSRAEEAAAGARQNWRQGDQIGLFCSLGEFFAVWAIVCNELFKKN
jgi:hypothetical protein